jgi:exodeoxyribonuclease VII large subunit
LDDLDFRMRQSHRARLRQAIRSLDSLLPRLTRLDPRLKLAQTGAKLDDLERTLLHLSRQRLADSQHRLEVLRTRLESLSPTRILARGYALVEAPGEGLVRDAAVLAPGMPVNLRFARGRAKAEIRSVQPEG